MTNSTLEFNPAQLLGVPLYSDWIGFVGLGITVIGFGFTLFTVMRSKTIAEQAKAAADSAIAKLRSVNVVADLSSIVAKLEEVKRIHRRRNWFELPERYSELRNFIITIKHSSADLTDEEQTILQQSLVQIKKIGTDIEKELQRNEQDNAKLIKYYDIISSVSDSMYEIVCKSKRRIGG